MLVNEDFFKMLFPNKKIIERKPDINYESNNIIFKNFIIFGYQGSGKTTTVNALGYYANKKYGKDNVNCAVSENGDLDLLLRWGLKPVLVNILFADNVTLRPLEKETLMRYFRIRHLFKQRYNLSNGYILSLISLHRFHSVPVELRTTIDGIIIKDSSLNPYDRSVLKRFIGQDFLDFLEEIYLERDSRPELKRYSIFISKGVSGLISLPLVKENYLRDVLDLKTLLKEGHHSVME